VSGRTCALTKDAARNSILDIDCRNPFSRIISRSQEPVFTGVSRHARFAEAYAGHRSDPLRAAIVTHGLVAIPPAGQPLA
jgi:hypothetical protein